MMKPMTAPPLPVVAQDGEAEEEDDDLTPGQEDDLTPGQIVVGAVIVLIVLIFLALSAANKALKSVMDFMSNLGH